MNIERRGIVIAGGHGTRLNPVTNFISKQLLPVYDKPMIYYPLSTLMLADIREILIITTLRDLPLFKNLLGNGNLWGLNLQYKVQEEPNGLAEAIILGEEFISSRPCALILGDNLFHGNDMVNKLYQANLKSDTNTIFAHPVKDPQRYGIVEFNKHGKVITIEEKPANPKSRYAITGLYFYDNTAVEKAKLLNPSNRGELEITDLNKIYLNEGRLNIEIMGRGISWFDTGTTNSLHDAATYVRTIQNRQGYRIGCPEEISWRRGWINDDELEQLAKSSIKSAYGKYLIELLEYSKSEDEVI